MAIFQGTLPEFIAAQLKAREMVISQWGDTGDKDQKKNPIFKTGVIPRQDQFLRYTTGKNAWVKMTSLVDYNSKIIKNGRFQSDNRYVGTQLAKKYVLEGGTLLNNSSLRQGVNKFDGGSYGSDLDLISKNDKKTRVDRLYGIRPMPGIESVSVISVSAYGSLKEATVTFYAWDRHQLSELEILFMRPGYSVLLEWGWSQYLKHGDVVSGGINGYPDNISIENFTTSIDAFASNISDEIIYSAISDNRRKYCGNYDGLLGFVKNFSWNLLPNGGFQCTTTLISKGEVLESLKASTTSPVILGPQNVVTTITSELNENRPILSFFEKVFLNLIGYINSSEITANGGQLNPNLTADGTPVIATEDQQQSILNSTIEGGKSIVANVKKRHPGLVDNDIKVIKPIDGGSNGSAIEYISFDWFLGILNTYFIPKNNKGENIVRLGYDHKDGGIYTINFLITEDTVSIDPTTCLVFNQKSTFVTGDKSNNPGPYAYESFSFDGTGFIAGPDSKTFKIQDDDVGNSNAVGDLRCVYVSIQKIIDVYRELYTPDGVLVIDLVTKMLDYINLALGGINDLKLQTDREKGIIIIDIKYLETGKTKNNKFIFDPLGLKSICRNVKINSRIFSDMSTMISIGAAANNTNNIGDIYSSTQAFFNQGIEDRIQRQVGYELSSKNQLKIGTETITGELVYVYQVANNVISLRNYIKYKVTGIEEYQGKPVNYGVTYVPTANEVLNASSLLQTIQYQINGNDLDYKAFIPYELEIELDGICSPTIGSIIRLSPDILPKDYGNKNVGFVITKANHSLKSNDWVTNLVAQIILLDTNEIAPKKNKARLVDLIDKIIKAIEQTTYLKYALTDYLMYLIYQSIYQLTKQKPPDDNIVSNINITPEFLTNDHLNSSLQTYTFKDFYGKWISFWRGGESVFLGIGSPDCKEGIDINNLTNFPQNSNDISLIGNDGKQIPFNMNQFQGWTYDDNNTNPSINKTFLQTGTSDSRGDGYQILSPFLSTDTFSNFLKKYQLEENKDLIQLNPPTRVINITNNYIDVKTLYTQCLNYIMNVYLPNTSQNDFKGTTSSILSVWFSMGGDDNKNKKYFGDKWNNVKSIKDDTPTGD
jgi:hypothetical protein